MENKKNVSRRSVLQSLSSLGASTALGTTLSSSYAYASAKKATAFALLGDRWHNFYYIRTALKKTLVDEERLSIDFRGEPTQLSKETLNEYKLLILLSDGMIFPGGYTTPYVMYDPAKIELVSDPPLPKIDETHGMWITPEQGKAIKSGKRKSASVMRSFPSGIK